MLSALPNCRWMCFLTTLKVGWAKRWCLVSWGVKCIFDLQYYQLMMGFSNTLATWCEEPTHWKRPWWGKDWRQEEKGVAEDEMVVWHHWLNGHESEQTLGDSEGQGNLACCSPWGCKESDMTLQLSKNKWGEPSCVCFALDFPSIRLSLRSWVYLCLLSDYWILTWMLTDKLFFRILPSTNSKF